MVEKMEDDINNNERLFFRHELTLRSKEDDHDKLIDLLRNQFNEIEHKSLIYYSTRIKSYMLVWSTFRLAAAILSTVDETNVWKIVSC